MNMMVTLDKLDEYGFDHTGTFRNKTEREENLLIKDVNGIKFLSLIHI